MIDQQLVERASRLIDVQLVERRKQIPIEIARIKRKAAATGNLQSSRTILLIQELCAREIEIRAVLTWQNLVRVHRTLDCNLIDSDLKEFMISHITEFHAELTGILEQNLMKLMSIEQVSLDEIRDHVIRKHEIEIDLYIDSLTRSAEKTGEQSAVTSQYIFHGSVGAVQTGANASANVVQNLGQGDKDALIQALELAREALSVAQEIADDRRQELVSIVDEVKAELQSGAPNNIKLQTLVTTIGTTIQTLASAGPAYQALKGALIPLGIMLP